MDTDRWSDPSPAFFNLISRRAALGRLVGAGAAAVLMATVGPDNAQATPEPQGEEANHFVLGGAETLITYDATAFAGVPQLTYLGPLGNRTFVGDEVGTEESAQFGRLITVLVEQAPDSHNVWLTLLLPKFNPMNIEDTPTPFATLAILTTHLTTIAGPGLIEGALQTYEVLELAGTANFLMF